MKHEIRPTRNTIDESLIGTGPNDRGVIGIEACQPEDAEQWSVYHHPEDGEPYWIGDFPERADAERYAFMHELIAQMSRMTEPRANTDPTEDSIETLTSLILRAKGILGLPQEFEQPPVCAVCGLPLESDDPAEDVCSEDDHQIAPCGHTECGEECSVNYDPAGNSASAWGGQEGHE